MVASPVQVDLARLFGELRARVGRIALAAVAGAALGVAWHLVADAEYLATLVASPSEAESTSAGSLAAAGDLGRLIGLSPQVTVSRKDEAIATLQSRGFLYEFIAEQRLLPVLTQPGPLGKLRQKFGANAEPKLADAYERFVGDVFRVEEDRRTGLIQLSVRWHEPEVTVRWLEALVVRLNDTMQAKARVRAAAAMDFLGAELAKTNQLEVRQAIYRLIEGQMKAAMLANVSGEFALRVIERPVVPDVDRPIGMGLLARLLLGAFLAAAFVTGLVLLRSLRQAVH